MNDAPPIPIRMCRWSDAAFGLAMVSVCTCGGLGVLPLLAIYSGWRGLRQIAASDGHLSGRRGAVVGMVIAVIALLEFGAAYVVFTQAKEAARRASCGANQRQATLGLMQYAHDWDEHLPAPGIDWSVAVFPYVKNTLTFLCPSSETMPGYALNPLLRSGPLSSADGTQQFFTNDTVVLFESEDGRTVAWRHLGTVNFTFFEGHSAYRDREHAPPGYGDAPGGNP